MITDPPDWDALTSVDSLASMDWSEEPPEKPSGFAIKKNSFHEQQRAFEKVVMTKRPPAHMIRPENAQEIVDRLPAKGSALHCVIRGDFIVGDLIDRIIRAKGPASNVSLATLSMSEANADQLAKLIEEGLIQSLHIVVSDYFAKVNKEIFPYCQAKLPTTRWGIGRVHCKVFCLPCQEETYVIHGSANMRSSANTENICVENDPELSLFHKQWMEEIPRHSGIV